MNRKKLSRHAELARAISRRWEFRRLSRAAMIDKAVAIFCDRAPILLQLETSQYEGGKVISANIEFDTEHQ